MQPTAGFVQRNLASAGIDPKSIDTVLLTHMHPDHSAGLTDMSNGQLLFPNAELVMHENELTHWFDDGAMAKVDERSAQLYFMAGREQVAPYKSRTRLFREGEVFPGVTAVPSLGHTPGHTAYLIASDNDQLMIWGDTVHVPEVQTAFPEAGMAFDTDLAAAAAARKRMFERVSADGILIAGMHLHFPAFSRLGPYATGMLDTMAYKRRELFEYWGHEASLMPVELYPLMRARMEAAKRGELWGGIARFTRENKKYVDAVYAEVASRTALNYIPDSDEIADAVVFLASDLSRAVTGQALDVNGGHYFH